MPRPWASVCSRSSTSSIGSPKNDAPPCCSTSSSERWMAPIDAVEMLPYLVVKVDALSPANCSIARRSFRSSSSSPLSSATLKISVSTPCCVGFRLNSRDSSSGPRSEIVARTGTPRLPNTSQNATGLADQAGASKPVDFSLSLSLGEVAPAAAMPERSPFDVGHEHRHTDAREMLRQHLQRHRLAGAGRAGDEPMAVGQRWKEHYLVAGCGLGNDERFGHFFSTWSG